MAEQYPNSAVLTLDSDFWIYRKHKNQEIPVIMPYIHSLKDTLGAIELTQQASCRTYSLNSLILNDFYKNGFNIKSL